MELRTLNRKIASLKNKNAKWRDEVQLVLVGCAYHAFSEAHNVDPCTNLVNALEGVDATALIHWIEAHMPARWDNKAEGGARFKGNKSFKGEYDPITLMSEPWWKLVKKPHQISSTFDCLDYLRSVIAKMEKEAKTVGKTVTHGDAIEKVKTLVAELAFVPAGK